MFGSDSNRPATRRSFTPVRGWEELENGELLKEAEPAGVSKCRLRRTKISAIQENLTGRKLPSWCQVRARVSHQTARCNGCRNPRRPLLAAFAVDIPYDLDAQFPGFAV